MKRILLSAVLLLACGAVQAQFNIRVYNMSEVLKAKPIDKVLFTAQYDLSFVGDTAHEDKHIDETMMLKVGSKSSLFYSYARFRMDSLIEMDKATGASQEIIQEHMKQGTSQVNYQIFKNYPEGKLTQLEPIAASNFRSEEKTEIPVWELHPDTALSSPTPATERPADSGGETTKLGTLRKFRAAKVLGNCKDCPA